MYQVCSYDNSRMTFDLFMAKSNLLPHIYVQENVEKKLFFFFKMCERLTAETNCMIKVV